MSRRKRQLRRMKTYLDSKKDEIIREEIKDFGGEDYRNHPVEYKGNKIEDSVTSPTISTDPLK